MHRNLLLILILILGSAHAARITVGPADEDYSRIQEAINNASVGDIIEVHSGTYLERLRFTKALTLIGLDTGQGMPLIDGNGSSSIITLSANGSTVQGFNLTGSGHCGCGSAGISVASSNNTVLDNVLYKNKYGIYVKPGVVNNTFSSNVFLDNDIAASDSGNNSWSSIEKAEGLHKLSELLLGKRMQGNYYSDYDEPEEGCNDTNSDGFCDQPRNISSGSSVDLYPATLQRN
jgi:parallel beta-helix repeat protein